MYMDFLMKSNMKKKMLEIFTKVCQNMFMQFLKKKVRENYDIWKIFFTQLESFKIFF